MKRTQPALTLALPWWIGAAIAPAGVAVAQVETSTPAAEAPGEAAPRETTPTLEERVANIEAKQDGTAETLGIMSPVLDALSNIKLSGYAQGRFEYHADSKIGVSATGKPATTTQFLVRRGRLKTTYRGQWAELVLQIDASSSGVSLKDAEATFVEPWSGLELVRITGGQFKWPFGYEVLQSSSERQMPERARVIRTLFPGERDRGFRLKVSYEWLHFAAAVVNGNGTTDSVYGGNDQNTMKDVVGRAGADFDWLVFGVSGYIGEGLSTKLGDATSPTTITDFVKARLGADAQVYLDVPSVGGLALKGEVVYAKDAGGSTPFGFWFLAVQNIGESLGVFARYDYFDADLDQAGDAISGIGGGAQYFLSPNFRLSAVYERPISHVASGADDPTDDIFTLQLQGMFP
ncbi:MAG: hypothetical protein IT384_28350 [Deltaproteobacteria bacterium]|nr:hypothetical protein [Deltaproteobacteria bacterium]